MNERIALAGAIHKYGAMAGMGTPDKYSLTIGSHVPNPNGTYKNADELHKPRPSYVVHGETGKVLSEHKTPAEAIEARNKLGVEHKVHFGESTGNTIKPGKVSKLPMPEPVHDPKDPLPTFHSPTSYSDDRSKVEKTMHEFKHGELRSGSKEGPVVTDRKQAVAIALNQARKAGEDVAPEKHSRAESVSNYTDESGPHHHRLILTFKTPEEKETARLELAKRGGYDILDEPGSEAREEEADAYSGGGKWIQGAIKHPGALNAKAGAAGESVKAFESEVLAPGSHASTETKHQANLARILAGFHHKK